MTSKYNSKYLSSLWLCLFVSLSITLWNPFPVLGEENQKIGADTIRENSRQFLMNELTWNPERLDIQIEYRGGDLFFPKGQVVWNFNLPGRKSRIGQVPFQLSLKQNGRILRQIQIQAQIKVTYDIFKVTRSLKRGHVLELNDVEINQVQSKKLLRNMVTKWSELEGYQLTRNVEEGSSLSTYMLRKVPLVKRGDRITLIAKRGSLKVSVPGVVRENGFKDQTVKVENIQSHKVVYGTVKDSRTVIVNF